MNRSILFNRDYVDLDLKPLRDSDVTVSLSNVSLSVTVSLFKQHRVLDMLQAGSKQLQKCTSNISKLKYTNNCQEHIQGRIYGGSGGAMLPPPRNGQAPAAPTDRAGEEGKRRQKCVRANQDRRCHAGSPC